MRRSLGVATSIALVVALASTAVAAVYLGYRDDFNAVSYWGDEGTLDWWSSWKEVGENDGAGSGAVFVNTDANCFIDKCLQIVSGGESIANLGAYRVAPTSLLTSPELSFYLKRRYLGGTGGVVKVQISNDGGATWKKTLLAKPFDASDASPVKYTFDISQWASTETAVRFVLHTPEGKSISGTVFVDSVWITGRAQTTTTTTTTTTLPETTSTTLPETTTTTTEPHSTTTTAPDETTTSSRPAEIEDTTTTTVPSSTTTTEDTTSTTTAAVFIAASDDPPEGPSGPPEGSGIREAETGIQADFDSALFGDVEGGTISISSVDHQVDYRMAFELIKSSWVWLVVLALVVAWSIVSGLDRRRSVAGA